MKHTLLLIILFFITYSCKQKKIQLQRIEAKQVQIDKNVKADKNISSIIDPYKKELEGKMNKVLAYAPEDLYKDFKTSETNIGNFMADLCYTRGNPIFNDKTDKNIDFVLLNYGGIRAGISKGDVTTKSAYEVMPFENNMVVAELTHQKLTDLLNYLAKTNKAHPVSKHLHLVLSQEEVVSVAINRKKINKARNYYVLTSDYLQNGGDHMDFFKNPESLTVLDYKIRKAILDELTAIDTIKAKIDGRVTRVIGNR